jgi:hypothetical protein
MKFTVLLFFLSANALGIEPMDDYYAKDLLDAVDQAKSSPHHYDYSNNYRYKRTTAQSIDLNRLNLNELDETRVKTNSDAAETSSNIVIANDNESITSKSNQPNVNNHLIKQTSYIEKNTQYSSNQGQIYSNGISDRSSITSTTRP